MQEVLPREVSHLRKEVLGIRNIVTPAFHYLKAMVLREISAMEKEPLEMVDLAVPGHEIVGKEEGL